MKVVHVVEAFGGGVFTFLTDLLNSLAGELDITLVYAIREQTPTNYKDYFDKRIKLIELKQACREINLYKDYKFFIELRNIIKNENPDVVHLHSSKAGFIGRMLRYKKGVKVFYNPHGYSFLKQDDSNLKRLFYKIFEKVAAMNKKSYTICVSKEEYNAGKKITKKISYINNGINIRKLEAIDIKKIINLDEIVTVGRISYQKAPEVFNNIAKKFPDKHFVWIGDGELRDKLDAPNIRITGWLSREETINELNKSSVFILMSLWEGLPIALLEAMYLKKLCLVSNVVGNKDVIKNNINGFIVNNINDCIDLIKELDEYTKEDLERLVDCARNDVQTTYNLDNMVKGYRKFYYE